MKRLQLLVVAALLISVTVLYAGGNKDKNNSSQQDTQLRPVVEMDLNRTIPRASPEEIYEGKSIRVTGRVRLVGNEPFTELVITGEGASWYIAHDEREKLHLLQHRTVTVDGEESTREIWFAGGQYAGLRRDLKNITIVSIE